MVQIPAPLITSYLASISFNLGLRSHLCKGGGGGGDGGGGRRHTVYVKPLSHHLASGETASRWG